MVVLRAKLKLVPRVQARTAVFLGYPDVASSADAVPSILRSEPIALGGPRREAHHLPAEKHLNPDALTKLPAGQGLPARADGRRHPGGGRPGGRRDAARRSARAATTTTSRSSTTRRSRSRCGWSASPGSGATARVPGLPDTWPGWEDSAVAVDDLGDYLRDLQKLYDEFGYGAGLALRALRSGLRALPHPVRPADRRWHRRLPPLRRTRRRPRGLLRRVVLRRARRRPAARRAAAEDVPTGADRGVRPVQGDLRPGRPDEPRQGRARRTRWTRCCAWASTTTTAAWRPRSATPRTKAASAGRCCAASVWGNAAATRAG